jgi:hypothetical protein
MVEQHAGVIRIGRALPEDRIARLDVRFALGEARRGIAAVAIGAAEHDVRRSVHRFAAGMALQTTPALAVGFLLRLINPVPFRQRMGSFARQVFRNGNFRAGAGGVGSTKRQAPSSREPPSSNHQTKETRVAPEL